MNTCFYISHVANHTHRCLHCLRACCGKSNPAERYRGVGSHSLLGCAVCQNATPKKRISPSCCCFSLALAREKEAERESRVHKTEVQYGALPCETAPGLSDACPTCRAAGLDARWCRTALAPLGALQCLHEAGGVSRQGGFTLLVAVPRVRLAGVHFSPSSPGRLVPASAQPFPCKPL